MSLRAEEVVYCIHLEVIIETEVDAQIYSPESGWRII